MRNVTIVQRIFVDRLFDIEHALTDPAAKIIALKAACEEARIYEQLFEEDAALAKDTPA